MDELEALIHYWKDFLAHHPPGYLDELRHKIDQTIEYLEGLRKALKGEK